MDFDSDRTKFISGICISGHNQRLANLAGTVDCWWECGIDHPEFDRSDRVVRINRRAKYIPGGFQADICKGVGRDCQLAEG